MRQLMECQGVELEAAFVEEQTSRATVLVYHVNPARTLSRNLRPVVKFSEKQFAIPRANYLKLASPRYYRRYEGGADGVGDEMEAQYRADVRPLLTGKSTLDPFPLAAVSGHVAYGVDDFWMFCTSIAPGTTFELDQLRKQFSAECVTVIPEPSEFARELGAAFAMQSSYADVTLGGFGMLRRWSLPHKLGDKVVCVYHGPVLYSDNAEELAESFPDTHRSTVVCFLKRCEYSWQREYRFTVGLNEQTRESEFFLPIPPELRRWCGHGACGP